MGILFIIPFLVLSVWALTELLLRLRRERARIWLWLAFSVLLTCGIAVGIWCGFYCEYHVGKQYRIGSFPIPVVFFHLEDGHWVDFPVPAFQAWLSAITDVICITALAAVPVWLVSWRQHKHDRVF